MSSPSPVELSSDPRTIWKLDEQQRPAEVIARLRACAREFDVAVEKDDAGAAQDMAIHALSSISGLFPDPSDGVQKMLQSICGVFYAAKWGVRKHVLLKASGPIEGMKRGLGHAILGGFCISAVTILTSSHSMSGRQARAIVAQILADARCSLKNGDHEIATPITGAAIRHWIDQPNSAQNEIAKEMVSIHAENLRRRSATTQAETIDYFRDHADEIVDLSRTL